MEQILSNITYSINPVTIIHNRPKLIKGPTIRISIEVGVISQTSSIPQMFPNTEAQVPKVFLGL